MRTYRDEMELKQQVVKSVAYSKYNTDYLLQITEREMQLWSIMEGDCKVVGVFRAADFKRDTVNFTDLIVVDPDNIVVVDD